MTASSSNWQKLEDLPADRRHAVDASITRLLTTHPDAVIDHEPRWLTALAQGEQRGQSAYVCLDDAGKLLGYAPFLIHPSALEIALAGRTLFEYPTRRHTLVSQPLLAVEGEMAAQLVDKLLVQLSTDLRGREVAFCLGAPMDSLFGKRLDQGARHARLTVFRHGHAYQRRGLKLPTSLDDYLQSLGRSTRKDLRLHRNRLARNIRDKPSLAVYTTPASVADLLPVVEGISRLTYQWRELGIGIRDSAALRQRLASLAEAGWLRCYVLHCADQAVAFQIGYLHNHTYYAHAIGYDPAWAAHAIGNMLHLHIVDDLIGLGGTVRHFDFLYGDNENKQRMSNRAHWEANYYLVPRRLPWTLLVPAVRGFDALVGAAHGVLERLGARKRIRSLLRRQSTGGARDKARVRKAV